MPGLLDSSSTRGIPKDWQAKLNGRNPYGTAGIINDGFMPMSEYSRLPEWMRSQFDPVSDEGGSITGFKLREGGNMRVKDGRAVTQVGDNSSNENIIDWSKVWEDPDLGLVTDPENRKQVKTQENFKNAVKTAIAAAAVYAGGGAMGAWGGGAPVAGGAQPLAGGAMDMGIGTAEMAANMGSQGLGQAATGAPAFGSSAGVGGVGAGTGLGGYEYLEPITLDPATPSLGPQDMLSYNGGGNGLLGSAMEWATKNPMQAYNLISSVGGLLGGNSNQQGNSGAPAGSGGLLTGKMNIPQQQFHVNPVTQAQIQNFKFATPRR
jgi:hypothetical protein